MADFNYDRSVVHTCGYIDSYLHRLSDLPRSVTIGTWFVYYLPASAAVRAGADVFESAERCVLYSVDLSGSPAFRATLFLASRSVTLAAARSASYVLCDFQCLFRPESRFFESNAQALLQIAAFHRTLSRSASETSKAAEAAPAEHVAERAENILKASASKAASAEAPASAETCIRIHTGMTESVVFFQIGRAHV